MPNTCAISSAYQQICYPQEYLLLESFVTAFIIYFVVVDPIGNAPVFLAVTSHLERGGKLLVAIESSAIAIAIMLFFALCGAWVLSYMKISEAAF